MNIFDYKEQLLNDQKILFEESRKIREVYESELKRVNEKISNVKLQINDVDDRIRRYSRMDVTKMGLYIAKLMTEIEGKEYIFHRAEIDHITYHFDYDRYISLCEEETIYMISPKDDLKNFYKVEYFPEVEHNPLIDENHILLNKNKYFYFYNDEFQYFYFDRWEYIKEFIDEVINIKYQIKTENVKINQSKKLDEIYKRIVNKYEQDTVKVKTKEKM